jgi:hypothetical protein
LVFHHFALGLLGMENRGGNSDVSDSISHELNLRQKRIQLSEQGRFSSMGDRKAKGERVSKGMYFSSSFVETKV